INNTPSEEESSLEVSPDQAAAPQDAPLNEASEESSSPEEPISAGSTTPTDDAEVEALRQRETPKVSSRAISFASFEEAGLNPKLLTAIAKAGWEKPTTIQSLCLPITLKGQDLAGFAQTGTGKTGVFLISIAQRL